MKLGHSGTQAALERDAARYRWLRSPNTCPSAIWELLSDDCHPPQLTLKNGADLDKAVDEGMKS